MKITFNSPAILAFSFLCVVVYILSNTLGLGTGVFALPSSFHFDKFSSYFNLFSYAFCHKDANHIIMNLSLILLLGPIIEEKYGTKKTIIIFFSTILITAIFHILFFDYGLIGASGIAFALIILASLVNFKNKEIPITFVLVAIIYIGREVVNLFEADQVSQFAHIIGGCIGAYFGFKFKSNSKLNSTVSSPDILKGLK